MKKILAVTFLLSGCVGGNHNVVVETKWPSTPPNLLMPCPDLVLHNTASEKLSDLIDVVGTNYSEYHLCKIKVDAWIEWYNKQKTIHEKVTQ